MTLRVVRWELPDGGGVLPVTAERDGDISVPFARIPNRGRLLVIVAEERRGEGYQRCRVEIHVQQ